MKLENVVVICKTPVPTLLIKRTVRKFVEELKELDHGSKLGEHRTPISVEFLSELLGYNERLFIVKETYSFPFHQEDLKESRFPTSAQKRGMLILGYQQELLTFLFLLIFSNPSTLKKRILLMQASVTPAYSRVYTSKASILADFTAGRDFILSAYNKKNSVYFSVRDIPSLLLAGINSFQFRYGKKTGNRVFILLADEAKKLFERHTCLQNEAIRHNMVQ